MKRLLALILCAAVLLCGCSGATNALGFSKIVKFEDMEYIRPDVDAVAASAQNVISAAETGTSVDAVLGAVWDYYDLYTEYITNSNLAYIRYNADLNDIYWEDEYNHCAEVGPQYEMYLEDIYYALADCDLREELEEEYFGEGYFDSYDNTESFYNEELMAILEQEQELIARYYELSAESQETEYYSEEYFEAYTMPLTQVLADLIAVRQELAQSAGYGSYPEFAWEYYYYRDYTLEQQNAYLEQIRTELSPIYLEKLNGELFAAGEKPCSEKEAFAYVEAAAKHMGGVTEEAFRLLKEAKLYDLSASRSKSTVSFELFIPRYYEPYVFISGTGTRYDCLTFAHEFGHFVMDYAAAGSSAGTDVMEIFSQGMEYLSLTAGTDMEGLVDLKLADCLCTYVEQAAYAAFETQMYSLTGDELTAENLLKLYEEILTSYGADLAQWDPRDLITVPHYYTNPMYIISYVVSNDSAFQLYQMELENPGAGRDCFEKNLETEQYYFLAFLEEAGLESPFDRIDDVKAWMEERFG